LTEFLAQLERAAESEVTVLLTGESGTGKTRAAERLHRRSSRATGPCVMASLAAASPTLIEATLFGHEKGAFTDAHRERAGLFRRADGGTLVLEDVDQLPLELQAKLLRVVQEREVEPLGAEVPLSVDVRVVATCNGSLQQAVQAGRFREDLYYRLAVVELRVPSLRQRTEDLPLLIDGLVPALARRAGIAARVLAPDTRERLCAHSWPGNVRELENVIERLLVLAPRGDASQPVEPDELAFLTAERTGAVHDLARTALGLGLTVEELSQAMMERALAEHRGNVSAAARAVGLTRRAFDYRLGRGDDADAGADGEEES